MSDSTASDAERIRAKRLAKLGGTQSTAPRIESSPDTNESPSTPVPPQQQDGSNPQTTSTASENPFAQLGMVTEKPAEVENTTAPQIKIRSKATSPARPAKDSTESHRVKQNPRSPETMENWQDRMLRQIFRVSLKEEELRDSHGHELIYLESTKADIVEREAGLLLNIDILEGVITEAASKAPKNKPFEYLLGCFKRVQRGMRATKFAGPDDPKHEFFREVRRLSMSYCIFAITIPEMFGENIPSSNPLADHLLSDPECDLGICQDFFNEAEGRFEDIDGIKEAFIGAAEELSHRLSTLDMLGDYLPHVRGFLSLVRSKPVASALTESSIWCSEDIEAQDLETKTLLGPLFRLSPMQSAEARNFFASPKTMTRNAIANNQEITRSTLRAHQAQLFQIVDAMVRASPAAREKVLKFFATCVNRNHKRRGLRVDFKVVSSDGFMVNVTSVLDQLCEPFMDAKFGKIDRIDVDYLRRNPRIDISDETKLNADQKTADAFYSDKLEGTSNFISEIFFLTVAAHHYGTESTQNRVDTMRKSAQRAEKDLEQFESERHKFVNDPRYLARFEEHLKRMKVQIDNLWSTIYATHGALLDTNSQARSMQFMRYVIVWVLRLASRQNLPKEQLQLPLPKEQPVVVRCLPEYILEDIVDNFKFTTASIPQILTPQQCDEITQVCITFLCNSEYVKNPGVKSGLVTILFYGVQPLPYFNRPRGVLGDILLGADFANKHLLRALMKFYIEAESTGLHTQFYDKFNIRYEIFQVIKCVWANPLYREKLAKEARVNTDFFVQFVNMLVNDVTFVLDESLSSFIKIRDLEHELSNQAVSATLDEEQRKAKEELLQETRGKAKSYMSLTKETMEMLKLFSESLADAFTMPEIVTRLADMLDYNLDTMVGPRRVHLKVEKSTEYGFDPQSLLADIVTVYINLSGKQSFVQAIARDGRSYKPANFPAAKEILKRFALKSQDELLIWDKLGSDVAAAKAIEDEEEADLGEAPDEFMDPLVFDLMDDPVILPTSKTTVNRSTIRSHLLSDPTDPFNRSPLKIEDVIPNTELKAQIDAWKAERKAAKAAERANQMDLS